MTIPSHGRASFSTQANALLRKNLVFQRRNKRSNCCLVIFPVLLCVLLSVLQQVIDNELNKEKYKCGCAQVNGTTECGIQYSTLDQALSCSVPNPQKWPALLQVPDPQTRAVRTDFLNFPDLPSESCRQAGSCPVTVLVTGSNRTLGQGLASNLFLTSPLNSSNLLLSLANNVLGTASKPQSQNFLDPAYTSGRPLYFVQPICQTRSTISLPVEIMSSTLQQDVACAQGLHLWRNSSSDINDELYKGYRKGNSEGKINEFVAAYDFLNSNMNNFNVSIWYNATYKDDTGFSSIKLIRVPRSVNLVSNAYLQSLLGPSTKMLLEFVKEMPKPETRLRIDISSLLSAQFFSYVIIALFPVVLTALVYEKQQRLRIMMKMHGLGDGPYWTISYAYFLVLSVIYMICFVIFGSLIDLNGISCGSFVLKCFNC